MNVATLTLASTAPAAAYQPSFTNFDKELRNGIVFYSSGWGWRLRVNWRETWKKKYDDLKTQETAQ